MTYACPKCQSSRIRCNNYAKKVGAFIGTLAGVLSASNQSERYSTATVSPVVVGKFPNAPIGRTADIIINALVTGTAGGAAGARLGEFIDQHILHNLQCLACKHKFSERNFASEEEDETAVGWAHQQPQPHYQEQSQPWHRTTHAWRAEGPEEDE
jgi:hypothetical protein